MRIAIQEAAMGSRFIRWSVLRAVLAAGFAFAPIPASAHHGVASFDESRLLTLNGTVSEIEFHNPHVHIYFDVRDAQGHVQKWTSESASPNILSREGWDRNAVKPGDQVEVTGHRAKMA
jgi:hypothetical protein